MERFGAEVIPRLERRFGDLRKLGLAASPAAPLRMAVGQS